MTYSFRYDRLITLSSMTHPKRAGYQQRLTCRPDVRARGDHLGAQLRSPDCTCPAPGRVSPRPGAAAMVHNSDMLPEAAAPDVDPLEQDAPDHPAIVSWFLADGDRANPATDLRMFMVGNLVDFRGDPDERPDGP